MSQRPAGAGADSGPARDRALEGVILVPEPGGELRVLAGKKFPDSWVHPLQPRLPFDDVQ